MSWKLIRWFSELTIRFLPRAALHHLRYLFLPLVESLAAGRIPNPEERLPAAFKRSLQSARSNFGPREYAIRTRLFLRVAKELSLTEGQRPHVYLVPSLSIGGAEKYTMALIQARQQRGQNEILILCCDSTSETRRVPQKICTVDVSLELASLSTLQRSLVFDELMSLLRPASVHIINSDVGWIWLINKNRTRQMRFPTYGSIFSEQRGQLFKRTNGFAAKYLSAAQGKLSALVTDNVSFVRDAAKYVEGDAAAGLRFVVAKTPVIESTSELSNRGGIMKITESPKSAVRGNFLWAGRISAEKKPDIILALAAKFPDSRFVVFGPIPAGGSAKIFTRRKNIVFAGMFTDPDEWSRHAPYDALIFSSVWEGMPNIILEAAVRRLPVIAPTVGGIAEYLNEETGYPLTARAGKSDYALAIEKVLSNSREAMRRAKNLRDAVLQSNNFESFSAVLCEAGYFASHTEEKGGSPIVSVIIPCFNQAAFLEAAILSCRSACSAVLEIIVVDDGSNHPNEDQAISNICSKFQEVSLFRQTNQGLSVARNSGLKIAKGSYIQFLDADDMLSPSKIDLQIAHLIAHDKRVISVCDYVAASSAADVPQKPISNFSSVSFELDDFLFHWESGFSVPIHCALFPKELLRGISFNSQLRAKEDWVFWVRLLQSGVSLEYLPVLGAFYRQHHNSMHQDLHEMGLAWMAAAKAIAATLPKGSIRNAFLSRIENWHAFYYLPASKLKGNSKAEKSEKARRVRSFGKKSRSKRPSSSKSLDPISHWILLELSLKVEISKDR